MILTNFPSIKVDGLKTPLDYAKETNAHQLTINMLELLTLDELTACGDTDADIRAAVFKKSGTMGDNQNAMANIVDYDAREKATVLQTKMFSELKAADLDAANMTFNDLKAFCGDQAKRLGDLIAVVMGKYKLTDPLRYKPFEQIKEIEVKEQTPAPTGLELEEQVKFQLANASWYEEEFQAAMNEIVVVFNSAASCEEICDHYGIENTNGKWSKELRAEVFNLDKNTNDVALAKFGPPKGFPRALEKMKQGEEALGVPY
jgi:hypothetical protein